MDRIEEIASRLAEIDGKVDSAQGDELTAFEAEVRSLADERKAIEAEAAKKQQLRSDIAQGKVPADIIERKRREEKYMENTTYGIDSVEYRSAWLKNLQGAKLNEVEQRAYASADTHNAIPTLVADKMFEKMVKLAPMLSEITLMRVAGNLKFVTQGTRNVAAVHTENTAVSAAADTVVTVTLGAKEFMKVIGISKAAANQNVDAFEAWLVNLLAGDIARAIDNYIITNSTNGIAAITYTTSTNQILNTATTGYTYGNICDLIALLPAAYDSTAKFLVNKKTLWGSIASIVNSSGNPIFVPDIAGGPGGRLLGYPVLVDDYVTTANNALYLGNWTDVVGNLSEGVNVERDESSGFMSATINYRGYAAFDSKPAKTDAIVRLVATA